MPRLKLPDGRVVIAPDDATADDINDIVQQFMSETPSTASPAAAAEKPSSWTDALPMAGGMVGGLLGGSKASPIGMGLAALGGAGGEAWKQVADSIRGDFSEVPETIMGRLKKIGQEGLTQAGYEGGGRLVSAAMQPIAKTIYGLSLRPSRAIVRDVGGGKVVEGTNRLIEQGLTDKVLPSGFGVGRAGRKVGESAADATRMAAASPQTVVAQRVLGRAEHDQAARMAKELADAGIQPKTAQVVEQIGHQLTNNPKDLTMSRLLEMRRGAEDIAAPVFSAAKLPGGAGRVAPGSEASVARSIAGATKQALDDTLGAPFQQINRRTQTRMGLKRAIEEAAARPNTLQNMLAGGVGLTSGVTSGDPVEAAKKAALFKLLFNPTAGGAAAIGLSKAPYAQLFRGSDAAGVSDLQTDVPALLRSLLGQDE